MALRNLAAMYQSGLVSDRVGRQGPNRLRAVDRAEVFWSTGRDPDAVLLDSFELSDLCWAARIGGRCAALWGACSSPGSSEVGVPWLLGSDELGGLGLTLCREGLRFVDLMQTRFPILVNYIHHRNRRSIRWLRRLGFRTAPWPEPFGPFGRLFFRFERRKGHV